MYTEKITREQTQDILYARNNRAVKYILGIIYTVFIIIQKKSLIFTLLILSFFLTALINLVRKHNECVPI